MAMSCISSSPDDQPRRTISTCTSETVQGTHMFCIVGYRTTKGLGVGKSIRSGTFNVGGYDWAILYYPDGLQQDCQGYVSVFLELVSKNSEVRAFFDLRLVNQTTGLPCSVFRESEVPHVFKNPVSSDWGFREFKERSELEASEYVRDDRLTIECVVRVVKDPPQVSNTKILSRIEVPPSDITEQLGKLLMEKECTDVTLIVQGEAFGVHKIILAMRSPVFKAQLYGPMREQDTKCITINDIQPAVFNALLHFIYTDSLPAKMDDLDIDDNKEMIRHLLVAADRYAMERLKLLCEEILCMSLDVETVVNTLALADQHQCDKLKDACVEFIVNSDKKKDVVASQGYDNLKRSCPSVIADIFERMTLDHKI